MSQHMVDTHAHIFAKDQDRYPYAPIGPLASWATERPVHGETLLQFMAEAGVDRAVLVEPSMVHGFDNSYVVDVARQHPDRFAAVVSINCLAPDAADRLSYWVQERSAAGLRLVSPTRDDQVEWLQVAAVWQRAQQLQIPLCVHLLPPLHIVGRPVLKAMLERFPEATMALDHCNHPAWKEGPPLFGLGQVIELARFPGVRLKFTTSNLDELAKADVEPAAPLQLLVGAFGAQRIMWGSNVPQSPGGYTANAERMRAAVSSLPESDQEWLLSRTALSLYPRLAAGA